MMNENKSKHEMDENSEGRLQGGDLNKNEDVYLPNSKRTSRKTRLHTDENCRCLSETRTVSPHDYSDRYICLYCLNKAKTGEPADDIDDVNCEYCNKTLQSKHGYYRHVLYKHGDVIESRLKELSSSDDTPTMVNYDAQKVNGQSQQIESTIKTEGSQ